MKPSQVLLLIAFVSGTGVTGIEISGARLLAPYFGTSLFVWTNVIGVILSALSLGYYLGGKISERAPRLSVLLKIIFAAGWLAVLTPWAVRPLVLQTLPSSLEQLGGSSSLIVLGSLVSSALLFGAPVMLLGMTSPFLIKLRTLHATDTGTASGSIFAFSTVGSILGTFLPTLVLIPGVGTRMTIVLFSALLIGLGSFGFRRFGKRLFAWILVLPLLYGSTWPLKPAPNLLAERDSTHQFLQVLQDPDGTRYIVANEGIGRQSLYHPDKVTTGAYFDAFTILPYLLEDREDIDILIIGLAGGTIARQLHAEFGDRIRLEAVEIDPAMTGLGRSYFGLDDIPVSIHHTDGRVFLQFTEKAYDIIIVDAYQNELYIPWTLTTEEFWQLAQEHLAPGGLVAININSSSEESPLLKSMANTMAKVFSHTSLSRTAEGSFNFLLFASSQPLDVARLTQSSHIDLAAMGLSVAMNVRQVLFNPENIVLIDNRAPVEFLTESSLIQYLRN